MWSGGEDFDKNGQQVRLYVPNLYGRKPGAISSFLGGGSPWNDTPPLCQFCHANLYQLVQLIIKEKTAHQVFACNQAACINQLFGKQHKFSHGGGGVVVARRCQLSTSTEVESSIRKAEVPPAMETTNEWADDSPLDISMDDIEAKMAALESNAQTTKKNQQSTVPLKSTAASFQENDASTTAFKCYELTSQLEPLSLRQSNDQDDDDYVGTVGSTAGAGPSKDHIAQMLARYMAEEDDENILTALKGSANANGTEREEQLSPADRALLTYTDRLKRVPRQVMRQARGGVPLWSIPEEPTNKKSKTTPSKIPPCTCGDERVFEFQLLPSLLSVLDVDKYSEAGKDLVSAYSQGAMDWGNIGVYSCSDTDCSEPFDFVVVQASVDEQPAQPRRMMDNEHVVIAEGTKFDDEDDEEEVELSDADDCA